jgi:hypothetical protein
MMPFLGILMVVQEIALLSVICLCLWRDRLWRRTVKNAAYQPQRLATVENDLTALQGEIIALREEIAI